MKQWVNGELLDATKMNTLEQSVPASATSSNGVVTFKNGNGTDLFSVEVGAPAPTNMIANGDFSAAGATTTGWSAMSASHSSIAVSGGVLVLTHTATSSRNYGIDYDITTEAGKTYAVKYKYKKTLSGTAANAKTVYVLLRGVKDNYLSRVSEIAQDDIVENVGLITTDSANTQLRFNFGGSISNAAANDSMLELYYVELYDVTSIVSGW